ncbi:hypothetical protein [Pseudovibrio sp. SCP19]|uniref:hypothetical protein n=1 Tax=Pseudovibrio sp. SCP19 TaxID=3141374 RepID=UPI00333D1200
MLHANGPLAPLNNHNVGPDMGVLRLLNLEQDIGSVFFRNEMSEYRVDCVPFHLLDGRWGYEIFRRPVDEDNEPFQQLELVGFTNQRIEISVRQVDLGNIVLI